MNFNVVQRGESIPEFGRNSVYLKVDSWNDYSFVTMFYMSLHDGDGQYHDIGNVKIGFKGQKTEESTYKKLPKHFKNLEDSYFSLGLKKTFYKNMGKLPGGLRHEVLVSLKDIVVSPATIHAIQGEPVFSISLLREASLSTVRGQYARVLVGRSELTNYEFKFSRPESRDAGALDIDFKVEVDSSLKTNIHAVVGQNGVGKTTLLNDMINAISTKEATSSRFREIGRGEEREISEDYFSSLVSVSFSAFDPFTPPREQPDPARGTCYFYVGLKKPGDGGKHKTIPELQRDCADAMVVCFYNEDKTLRWQSAIEKLGSDENFSAMELDNLKEIFDKLRKEAPEEQVDSAGFRERYCEKLIPFFDRMSSGHAIVLLTITRLVATVEEKTIVLLDEPESHLHPPLLSAFVRALSDLLYDQNGMAIIATHSPVVLQEIPKSCIWKIVRRGFACRVGRPDVETFGENVGVLTREIFGLEVINSGFHEILKNSAKGNREYREILDGFGQQLGIEGRAILRALIHDRDRKRNRDE